MRGIVCPDCKQSLSLDHFYPSDIRHNTTHHRCKNCTNENPKRRMLARQWRNSNKTYLKEQVTKWRRNNPEKWKEIARRSRINTMEKVLIRNREREILAVTAMPPWADRRKIRAIYEEAKRLTGETGVRHEVDHIYPLKGKIACGLHVENNLQIITGTANRKKLNRMPEEIAC